ncbi:hypothetical protein ACFOHT_26970 [Massilia oculi]|uniref:Pilus assembly protein PilX n=1 Tax=Massilia oculi TaxID=945844 RepID=A0A2S2DPG6_9BURK|nr:hypothetical protein [Massilia oculi]AWL07217.1 hypothetical protein DIR46_24170 [Massilia oculi]
MTHLPTSTRSQAGVALPVMLIMMLVMLVTSIYLLRSSNSATLAASNLAYDATLSRAVDFGLHTGFQWLSETASADKASLNQDDLARGYHASLDTTLTPKDKGFWDDSFAVEDADGNRIQYVIHRMCRNPGSFSSENQECVLTSANTVKIGNRVAIGESLASDAPAYASSPQIHYVITARIDGARGGNVINQMAVLIGA